MESSRRIWMSVADTFLVSGNSFNAVWFPVDSGVEMSHYKIPLQASPFFPHPLWRACSQARGGVLNKVLYREALPQYLTPYLLNIIIYRKGTTFVYLSLTDGTPFTNLV